MFSPAETLDEESRFHAREKGAFLVDRMPRRLVARAGLERDVMSVMVETVNGLYCPAGDFYIDPWRSVRKAVVTHAHSDHARAGCESYLAAKSGDAILRMRLGAQSNIDFLSYGCQVKIGDATVSLHPAGHMTGSAQVRVEVKGRVTVVTGDYKLQPDPTCEAFEPVKCDTFITESTFGLPIYSWHDTDAMFSEINRWWTDNQAQRITSVLLGYSVGKAQRLLASIDSTIGPIYGHGAIVNACEAYRRCGIALPNVQSVTEAKASGEWHNALIIAPPSVQGSAWLRRFGKISTGMASGWMRVRGIRRRRSVDRGFVISDHVDWNDLFTAIQWSEASDVWVTHGYTQQVVQMLVSQGRSARVIRTEFTGDDPSVEEDGFQDATAETS